MNQLTLTQVRSIGEALHASKTATASVAAVERMLSLLETLSEAERREALVLLSELLMRAPD